MPGLKVDDLSDEDLALSKWLDQDTVWPSQSKHQLMPIVDMPVGYLHNARNKLERLGVDGRSNVWSSRLWAGLTRRITEQSPIVAVQISETVTPFPVVLPSQILVALQAHEGWRTLNPIDLSCHIANHLNGVTT